MRVLALDNFITGSRDNLKTFESHPDFEFRQHDINHGIFLTGDVRYVLHFASPASPPQYDANPIHTLKVGTVGTMTVDLPLKAGSTIIQFANPDGYAPDFDAVMDANVRGPWLLAKAFGGHVAQREGGGRLGREAGGERGEQRLGRIVAGEFVGLDPGDPLEELLLVVEALDHDRERDRRRDEHDAEPEHDHEDDQHDHAQRGIAEDPAERRRWW